MRKRVALSPHRNRNLLTQRPTRQRRQSANRRTLLDRWRLYRIDQVPMMNIQLSRARINSSGATSKRAAQGARAHRQIASSLRNGQPSYDGFLRWLD
jgi:hypothetical protein